MQHRIIPWADDGLVLYNHYLSIKCASRMTKIIKITKDESWKNLFLFNSFQSDFEVFTWSYRVRFYIITK